MSAFKISGNSQQIGWIEQAIHDCTFDANRLLPKLKSQTGRDAFPVSFADLGPSTGGLAYSDGKVVVSSRLNKQDAMEVFVMEGFAHMSDFFYLTANHRDTIYSLFHPTGRDGHSWFEPSGYWQQVGEAWMFLFVWAFTPYRPASQFTHRPTESMAASVRAMLGTTPQPPQPPNDLPSKVVTGKWSTSVTDVSFSASFPAGSVSGTVTGTATRRQ